MAVGNIPAYSNKTTLLAEKSLIVQAQTAKNWLQKYALMVSSHERQTQAYFVRMMLF